MPPYTIRRAARGDKDEWLRMRQCLWPDAPMDYLGRDLDRILADPRRAVFLAAHADGGVSAFIEVSLRDYAEGCESSPVGYIEAWYVDEIVRGQGLGGRLMNAAEDWARERGCEEVASDTWLENEMSINIHEKLGYREVDRLVHFVKRL